MAGSPARAPDNRMTIIKASGSTMDLNRAFMTHQLQPGALELEQYATHPTIN